MTVEQQVKTVIAEQFGISPDSVGTDDHLVKFNIDSLDIVEIVMHLEETFKIAIEDSEHRDAQTVSSIIKLCESKIAAK